MMFPFFLEILKVNSATKTLVIFVASFKYGLGILCGVIKDKVESSGEFLI